MTIDYLLVRAPTPPCRGELPPSRGALAARLAASYINFGMSGWTVETLDATVTAEIEALPADIRARLVRVADLVQQHGLAAVGAPHIRHIEGKLWEIRAKGRTGIARALYVTVGRRFIVVRAFVKKTQKTPRREINLALRRAQRVID